MASSTAAHDDATAAGGQTVVLWGEERGLPMRQILSTALVALIVAALTAVTVSALAQDAPTTERTVSPAAVSNINAHRVDGKHAVGFTNKRLARRNKLVATNRQGFLPSNIVKPFWGAIKHKPAGFADGVDNEGVTGVTVVTTAAARTLAASATPTSFYLNCPAGLKATGGGFSLLAPTTRVLGATPFAGYYYLDLQNTVATADDFSMYVTCLTTDGGASVASRLTRAARDARPGK